MKLSRLSPRTSVPAFSAASASCVPSCGKNAGDVNPSPKVVSKTAGLRVSAMRTTVGPTLPHEHAVPCGCQQTMSKRDRCQHERQWEAPAAVQEPAAGGLVPGRWTSRLGSTAKAADASVGEKVKETDPATSRLLAVGAFAQTFEPCVFQGFDSTLRGDCLGNFDILMCRFLPVRALRIRCLWAAAWHWHPFPRRRGDRQPPTPCDCCGCWKPHDPENEARTTDTAVFASRTAAHLLGTLPVGGRAVATSRPLAVLRREGLMVPRPARAPSLLLRRQNTYDLWSDRCWCGRQLWRTRGLRGPWPGRCGEPHLKRFLVIVPGTFCRERI